MWVSESNGCVRLQNTIPHDYVANGWVGALHIDCTATSEQVSIFAPDDDVCDPELSTPRSIQTWDDAMLEDFVTLDAGGCHLTHMGLDQHEDRKEFYGKLEVRPCKLHRDPPRTCPPL